MGRSVGLLFPDSSRFQVWIDCTLVVFCPQIKTEITMKFLVVLSAVAMAMAQEQPANFACPNYPFCAITATPAAAIASIPGYDLVMQQRANLNAPLVAHVPGIDQWYAALHQQQAAMGLNPGIMIHNAQVARVQQEEARLLAYAAGLA